MPLDIARAIFVNQFFLTLLADRQQIGLPSDFIRRRHNWLLHCVIRKTSAEIRPARRSRAGRISAADSFWGFM